MDNLWKPYNPNPSKSRVGDCTVRAICKATGKTWEQVYAALCAHGFMRCDMPSANHVWGAYLRTQGPSYLAKKAVLFGEVRQTSAINPLTYELGRRQNRKTICTGS